MIKKTNLVFSILILSLIIDISGFLHIKDVVFISVFLIQLYYITTGIIDIRQIKTYKVEIIVFMVLPILISAYSLLFKNISYMYIIPQVSAFSYWLILPFLLKLNNDTIIETYRRILYSAVFAIIITFILIAILISKQKFSTIGNINNFFNSLSLGYIGLREITKGMFVPNVFFRWTFMILPAVLLQMDNSILLLIVGVIATIMTISTGAISSVFLGLLFIAFLERKSIKNYKKLILYFMFFVITVVFLVLIFQQGHVVRFVLDKFSTTNESTSVKVGHIQSILFEVSKSWRILLFGMGIGSSFYSKGLDAIIVDVEVSYLSLMRQFGLVYMLIFVVYVMWLVIKLISTDRRGKIYGVGLLALFIAAGTNPLLISPVFFVPLMLGRVYLKNYKGDTNGIKQNDSNSHLYI